MCTQRSSHTPSWPRFCARNVSSPSCTGHVALHSVPSVCTCSHLHSLSSSRQCNSVFSHNIQHSSPRLSAYSFFQTFHPSLTQTGDTKGSDISSLLQQKKVLTTSPKEYKIALRQTRMKLNGHAICIFSVTLACELFQRDSSKLTARNKCRKQLNRELLENAVFAFQKQIV